MAGLRLVWGRGSACNGQVLELGEIVAPRSGQSGLAVCPRAAICLGSTSAGAMSDERLPITSLEAGFSRSDRIQYCTCSFILNQGIPDPRRGRKSFSKSGFHPFCFRSASSLPQLLETLCPSLTRNKTWAILPASMTSINGVHVKIFSAWNLVEE